MFNCKSLYESDRTACVSERHNDVILFLGGKLYEYVEKLNKFIIIEQNMNMTPCICEMCNVRYIFII